MTIQHFFLFRVGLRHQLEESHDYMRVVLLMQEPAFWCRTPMCCGLLASRGMHTYASWYCCERAPETDTEQKKLLNKVVSLVFFVHKVFS